jgi:hypothetical protein
MGMILSIVFGINTTMNVEKTNSLNNSKNKNEDASSPFSQWNCGTDPYIVEIYGVVVSYGNGCTDIGNFKINLRYLSIFFFIFLK